MTTLQQSLGAYWNRLAPREKTALLIAAMAVGAVLLWAVLLAPALHTVQKAGAQHLALDTQLQQMKRLQAQALALKAQPKFSQDVMVRELELSLKPLGPGAQLQLTGSQATVTLRQIPAEVLAPWLIQVRTQAHIQPAEARLVRNAALTTAAWDGTVVFRLPPAANAPR